MLIRIISGVQAWWRMPIISGYPEWGGKDDFSSRLPQPKHRTLSEG
jgi:hypothetical protein